MNSVSNCIVCGKKLTGKQRSFCSTHCKNGYYLSYKALKKRALERKSLLVAEHGGKCSNCGYDKDVDVLSFYDRGNNTLHMNINVLANSNFEKLREKLENAQVLCRNCVEQGAASPSIQLPPRTDVVSSTKNRLSEKEFTSFMNKFNLNNGKIIVAVSGGIDSVVMLDLLTKTLPREQLTIAHLNHGYREEADDDERFVRELAKYYSLNYVTKKITPPTEGNLEEYFRIQRREFLLSAAVGKGCGYVALAHNQNDQAETVIMNLVRGSGPTGLGGMFAIDGKIIRPLLDFPRVAIENYAREHNLPWQEDTTNADTRFTRNYVRKEILPLLSRINPGYLENISRSARLQQNISKDNDNQEIIAKFERATGSRQNLTQKHVEAIAEKLTEGAGTAEISLPGGVSAVTSYGSLEILPKISDNKEPKLAELRPSMGTQRFGNFYIEISEGSRPTTDPYELQISRSQLSKLLVRPVQPGDKIDKYGINGQKKLQDLYVDAKIGKERRKNWPVFVDETKNQIIWVPGLAISKGLVPQTGNIVIKIREEHHEAKEK